MAMINFVCLSIVFLSIIQCIDISSFDIENQVLTVISKYSVNQTMDIVETRIRQEKGKIFIRIDQKKEANDVGLINQLDETQFILFGNPRVGTQLMIENGFVSIELPLRAVSWRRNEIVYLSITNPKSFEKSYNLFLRHEILQIMTNNIMKILSELSFSNVY